MGHDALANDVTTNKTETDDKLRTVEDDTKDTTRNAKDEIVKQIEEQSKRINKQLSKHDINHKITQKHILHTAGPVPPAEGWIKKNYKSEWEDAVAEGYYESQP